MSKYEPVIGIETHVQLATKSKLFCGCDNDSREAKPNAHVCPVCLALPGALPVLNGEAVGLALRVGLALNAEIPEHTKFDRKNYFYPDSPMNYQITQYDQPIVGRGHVEFPVEGRRVKVGVTRAHLEADAGKLTHPAGADYSLVDLNRAGTPLMEIVSEPDMCSAAEAKGYAQELYHLMRYAGVSDADLYYGNMRFDVNVSLRPVGSQEFGTRTETKNLNSFRAVFNAVEFEVERQTKLLEAGEKVVQETRGWNEDKQETFTQRSKEEAHDYRYFPEPDLPPLVITESIRKKAQSQMPELMPNDLRETLHNAGVDEKIAETIVGDVNLQRLYVETSKAVSVNQQHKLAGWLTNDLRRIQSENANVDPSLYKLTPEGLKEFLELVDEGIVSSTNLKIVFEKLTLEGGSSRKIVEDNNLLQLSDTAELERIVDQVIADNPGPAEQYVSGDDRVLGFLVGQVMKASKGQANPPMVNDILKSKLKR